LQSNGTEFIQKGKESLGDRRRGRKNTGTGRVGWCRIVIGTEKIGDIGIEKEGIKA